MTNVYLNYPSPHVTLHGDKQCRQIHKMGKAHRDVPITLASFASAIHQLTAKSFRLGAEASINDVWLSVDFEDPDFEEAVARYVHRLLAQRYAPLRSAPVNRHC